MSFSTFALPFLVVVILLIVQTFCRDASHLVKNQALITNAWFDKTTTAWPALGFKQNNFTFVQNPTWVRSQTEKPFYQPSSSNLGPQAPSASTNVSLDDELREFSEILLQKDTNNAAKYVTINYQGRTTSRSRNDEAPQPLLTINRAAFDLSSIAKLILLHNNYIVDSTQNEYSTPQEKLEETSLIETISETAVMQAARNFLIEKGKLGRDPHEFRNVLNEIWFDMYARGGGRVGSSGFEHVFLAELKNNKVSGLHNWLYFGEQEEKHSANYLGYLKKIDLGNKGAILKYHFTFQGVDKPVGSMFIGTSPELEMALYTVCFLLKPDVVCPLKLNNNRLIIRTYTYRYRGKKLIGSAFPEI